mmetsp:Transcript_11290/g.18684  ORF Transcript_11290/g.18684 Transcript_11290/m.18684 type:complete len:255 (-) Transcript_11290:112-876(-)
MLLLRRLQRPVNENASFHGGNLLLVILRFFCHLGILQIGGRCVAIGSSRSGRLALLLGIPKWILCLLLRLLLRIALLLLLLLLVILLPLSLLSGLCMLCSCLLCGSLLLCSSSLLLLPLLLRSLLVLPSLLLLLIMLLSTSSLLFLTSPLLYCLLLHYSTPLIFGSSSRHSLSSLFVDTSTFFDKGCSSQLFFSNGGQSFQFLLLTLSSSISHSLTLRLFQKSALLVIMFAVYSYRFSLALQRFLMLQSLSSSS